MNNIQTLIQQYCPDGVEFKELGEVCKFQRGKTITKKDTIEGNVPVIAGGQTPAYYHNESNRTGETISVSSSGAYAGFVNFWDIPVFLSDSFSVNPNKELLLTKYVFHFLKSKQDFIFSTKKGGGVPHVHGSDLAKIQIPIPPLPVQQEIANILDKFTSLEAELEAELEARRAQYEFYRNKLLTFNDDEVEWKTLGEVCSLKAGKSISADNISLEKNNKKNYACIGGNGIRGFVENYNHEGQYPIIGRQGALCGNLFYAEGFFYATEHAVVVTPNFGDNTRFLYYLLDSMNLNQYATGGAQPGLAVNKLNKIQIPIPPLSEQERIVSILDKFDALVNDILEGLPAEIEVRRKQYEYYRNLLLDFKPLSA